MGVIRCSIYAEKYGRQREVGNKIVNMIVVGKQDRNIYCRSVNLY